MIYRIMDFVLFGAFSLVTLSFVPLFITIMIRLYQNYKKIYKSIRFKLVAVFSIYFVFLTIRLLLFADIKLFHFFFDTISIYEAIPVYFTEIVITLSLAYVLFSISKMSTDSSSLEEQKRRTNFISVNVRLQSDIYSP